MQKSLPNDEIVSMGHRAQGYLRKDSSQNEPAMWGQKDHQKIPYQLISPPPWKPLVAGRGPQEVVWDTCRNYLLQREEMFMVGYLKYSPVQSSSGTAPKGCQLSHFLLLEEGFPSPSLSISVSLSFPSLHFPHSDSICCVDQSGLKLIRSLTLYQEFQDYNACATSLADLVVL